MEDGKGIRRSEPRCLRVTRWWRQPGCRATPKGSHRVPGHLGPLMLLPWEHGLASPPGSGIALAPACAPARTCSSAQGRAPGKSPCTTPPPVAFSLHRTHRARTPAGGLPDAAATLGLLDLPSEAPGLPDCKAPLWAPGPGIGDWGKWKRRGTASPRRAHSGDGALAACPQHGRSSKDHSQEPGGRLTWISEGRRLY